MMPSGRADAFAASKYLIVEPSTLCVPAILCHLRGACLVQDNAGYRVRAVIASIVPLVRYGSELSQLAQQHVSPALLAQASGVLFNWPFDFLPETARASLAAPSQQRDDPSVARRLEKEQASLVHWGCKRATCNFNDSPPAVCAGRPARIEADGEGAHAEPARRLLHQDERGSQGVAGHRHVPQGTHALAPSNAQHARRGVRPGCLHGSAAGPTPGGARLSRDDWRFTGFERSRTTRRTARTTPA